MYQRKRVFCLGLNFAEYQEHLAGSHAIPLTLSASLLVAVAVTLVLHEIMTSGFVFLILQCGQDTALTY